MNIKVRINLKRMGSQVLLAVFLVIIIGFWSVPVRAEVTTEDCLACHSDKDLEAETERGKKLNLFVPENALDGSAHEGFSCTDCHTGAKSFEEIPHSDKPMTKACADCHEDAKEAMTKDVHGKARAAGDPNSPFCCDCHGGHQILPLSSPYSRFSKLKQVDTCGKCHGSDKLNLVEKGITKRNLVERYKSSIHWQAILEGKKAATCTDCHGYHGILSSASSESGVSRVGVANSCQKCHTLQAKSFWSGAHGSALYNGNHDVPTCTTCHGDHDMASLRARVGDAKQWASTQVCIWCHGNQRMMARYGLNTDPVESYMKDFHGLTQRSTMGASATCSDCHDPHHSLPANHPSSRMHISNRGPACGKCHGKVSENFAMSFTHKVALRENPGGNIENIIRILYIILIIGSVAGMIFYNLLIWIKAVRDKIKKQRTEKKVKRMTPYEKHTHMILFITFSILVLTGFALKFPDAFWVKWLFAIGMTETIRAFIHRIAAVAMTVDLVIFGFYLLLRKRGKKVLNEILPRKRDFTDFWKCLKYYLGITKSDHPPKFALFNFTEKFEFWALVWGTVVMVVSGLVLWFPTAIPGGWPAWIINVARVIHFYEALLATLAILIWHGFHTILHPAEYPMNTSWLTGYVTEEEAAHHFEGDAVEKMKK
jgi:cytochrome b subunit of formate dehydrogenase